VLPIWLLQKDKKIKDISLHQAMQTPIRLTQVLLME
jgi:hypothetical protein